jgi:hypothetical protein
MGWGWADSGQRPTLTLTNADVARQADKIVHGVSLGRITMVVGAAVTRNANRRFVASHMGSREVARHTLRVKRNHIGFPL